MLSAVVRRVGAALLSSWGVYCPFWLVVADVTVYWKGFLAGCVKSQGVARDSEMLAAHEAIACSIAVAHTRHYLRESNLRLRSQLASRSLAQSRCVCATCRGLC